MVGGQSLAQNVVDPEDAKARPKQAAQHSGRLLVRMPATLHDELARAAETEGVSLNQFITGVLAGAVEWGGDERSGGRGRFWRTSASPRVTWIALVVNFAVVLVAAVVAIALLVVAWQQGW
jgi:hypothetical protein